MEYFQRITLIACLSISMNDGYLLALSGIITLACLIAAIFVILRFSYRPELREINGVMRVSQFTRLWILAFFGRRLLLSIIVSLMAFTPSKLLLWSSTLVVIGGAFMEMWCVVSHVYERWDYTTMALLSEIILEAFFMTDLLSLNGDQALRISSENVMMAMFTVYCAVLTVVFIYQITTSLLHIFRKARSFFMKKSP